MRLPLLFQRLHVLILHPPLSSSVIFITFKSCVECELSLYIVSADIPLSLSLFLSRSFFFAVGGEGHRVRGQEHRSGRAHGGRNACICGECTLIGCLQMLIGCLDMLELRGVHGKGSGEGGGEKDGG